MVVSRRSGNSRPPRWAARLQARVGSGSASPPPVEPTNLASALSLLPVWPGAPCVCWPTRRCCQVGTPPGGAIRPNFRRTLGRCRRRLESTPQAQSRYVRRLMLLVALRHLPAAPLLHCAVRWQTHQTARLRGRSQAWWRRAAWPSDFLSDDPYRPSDHPDDPSGSVGSRLDRRRAQREQARSDQIRPGRRRASGS